MKKSKKQKQQSPTSEQSGSDAGIPAEVAAPVSTDSTAAPPGEVGSEPVASRAAVPALLFGLLAVLLFWSDMHIIGQGGELDARVHYPFKSSNELAGFAIREPQDPRLAKGEAAYKLICLSCHQADGLGGVAQGCPPLAGSDWVLEKDPSRLAAIVLKGLTGPVKVSGKDYGTGTMLGLEGTLSDEDVASVLSYIRNNWGNKAPLVETEEVKKVRALVKAHPGYLTVPDLEKLVPLKP